MNFPGTLFIFFFVWFIFDAKLVLDSPKNTVPRAFVKMRCWECFYFYFLYAAKWLSFTVKIPHFAKCEIS